METVEIVMKFEIGKYPVTNKQYEEFNPTHERCAYSDQDDQPVVNVSWEDAVSYCKWLSEKTSQHYRLPSEAEWEFAASGGVRKYPWGDDKPTPDHANYCDSCLGRTTPVGNYPLGKTPEGIMDMAGNVWEWCEDWYDETENSRVLRGGSFGNFQGGVRCAFRGGYDPDGRYDNIGFRVVRALSGEEST